MTHVLPPTNTEGNTRDTVFRACRLVEGGDPPDRKSLPVPPPSPPSAPSTLGALREALASRAPASRPAAVPSVQPRLGRPEGSGEEEGFAGAQRRNLGGEDEGWDPPEVSGRGAAGVSRAPLRMVAEAQTVQVVSALLRLRS